MEKSLRNAYQECAKLTRREAKNFYYAFLLLPPARRRAIYAIYSFCRIVDDAADLAPSAQAGQVNLAALRQELNACLAGQPNGPVFTALADAKKRYGLNANHLIALLDGVEQDITVKRYATFAELHDYCWKVASAVGLLTLQVFGYRDSVATKYAEDLGLAMQLTNILRDINEDLALGRIYLPQDELAHYGITEDALLNKRVDQQFQEFMRFQVQRARAYFVSGAKLTPLVSWSSRSCPLMLQAVYSRILDHIEEADYDIFSRRIGPSGREKVILMFRSWSQWLLTLQPRRG